MRSNSANPMMAAITAGGRADGPLAAAIGTRVKALAPFAGGKLIDTSISAARAAGAKQVAVIGGSEVREHCASLVDLTIDGAPDGRENLRLAIETAAGEPLLLLASDLPFVTGDVTHAFVERALGCDVALPLASEETYRRAYPGAPSHVTRVGKDRVANGSVVYFAGGVAPRMLEVAQRLFAARKSLFGMARLLGPTLLVRFVVNRLEIEHVEKRAHEVLGIQARAIRDASPALCYDVDTLADYRYALERLAQG